MEELKDLETLANTSISQIDQIIKSKSIDEFINLEETFERIKAANKRLAFLVDLNEDFLYEYFLPVLCQPSSTTTFEGFSQEHRDSLARLRHRAMMNLFKGAVPAN